MIASHILRHMLRGAALLTGFAIAQAHAQAPVPEGPRYVATYVEVMPTEKNDGAAFMRQFRDASRNEAGNLRVEAARRIGQPNQFVVLEAWKDQAALDAHAKAAHTVQFHDKLKAIQIAPYDERVNYALSVGPLAANLGGAAILVVTHVDVIPPQRDTGTAVVKQLAEDGRQAQGNLRYEALTQVSRPNHFTIIAVWRNRKAADASSMNAKTRAAREKLAPAAGALYDERFYKALD